MGRRPWWDTGPTKKQIRAAIALYTPSVPRDEVRRLRQENFLKRLTKIKSAVELKGRKLQGE